MAAAIGLDMQVGVIMGLSCMEREYVPSHEGSVLVRVQV